MGSKSNEAQVQAMNRAIEEQKKARQRIEEVDQPDYEQIADYIRAAAAERPELMGLYEAIERDPSALEDIVTDPRIAEIQQQNLESMQEMAEEGLTEADLAERRELQRDVAAGEQARQKSILRQMAERGQSGSGAELIARLSSNQESTQRAAEAGDRLTMDQANARRAALQNASNAAQSLRQQNYGEQSNLAQARDQIAAFNAMNRQNVQAQNLQQSQQMENQRAAQQQQMYGQLGNLQQQKFSNEMTKAGAYANATQPIAQMTAQNVKREQGPLGTIGTLVGAGVGAYAGGAQGAGVGAQLGGALGGSMQSNNSASFQDGGVKGLTDAQMAGRSAEADYMNQKNFGDNPYAKAMYGERPQRSTKESFNTLLDKIGRTSEETEKTVPSDKPKNDNKMLNVLGGIAANMPSNDRRPENPINVMSGSPVVDEGAMQSLGDKKLIAADGGIKDVDGFRDQILGELQKFEDGGLKGMAYEDGGEGTIIPGDSYAGDELEDRINSGEMVLNVEQQENVNDKLLELKRLKNMLQSGKRVDTMLDNGELEPNVNQQEALMSVARGEMDVEELPDEKVISEPSEPSGRMAEFIGMLGKKKRR